MFALPTVHRRSWGCWNGFHQTLKSEEVYWRLYDSPGHARECLKEFRRRYNEVRPHWALGPVAGGDPVTPKEVYVDGVAVGLPRWQKWAIAVKEKLQQITQGEHSPTSKQMAKSAA